jgi:hypothetical protein
VEIRVGAGAMSWSSAGWRMARSILQLLPVPDTRRQADDHSACRAGDKMSECSSRHGDGSVRVIETFRDQGTSLFG